MVRVTVLLQAECISSMKIIQNIVVALYLSPSLKRKIRDARSTLFGPIAISL